MKRRNWAVLVAGLACASLVGAANAQVQNPSAATTAAADSWILKYLPFSLRSSGSYEQVQQQARSVFLQWSTDGLTISEKSIADKEAIQRAQQRAQKISQWAQLDLDGDGVATRPEIEIALRTKAGQPMHMRGVSPTPEQLAQSLSRLVTEALAADRNGDGQITLAEAIAAAEEKIGNRSGRARSQRQAAASDVFSLDSDGDGTVTLAEFESALARLYKQVDTDGDGKISSDEANAMQRRMNEAREAALAEEKLAQKAAACGFPRAAPASKVLLVGTYEGAGIANVIIGQRRGETGVVDIRIEPGNESLHLVLTSFRPTIWRFSGVTERVAQATIAANAADDKSPGSGVIGLATARVFVAKVARCLGAFTEERSKDAVDARNALMQLIGKAADIVSARYTTVALALPSGNHDDNSSLPGALPLPTSGPGLGFWQTFQNRYRKGVIDIDPVSVVATTPARKLDVLPADAGIAQFLDTGALEGVGEELLVSTGDTIMSKTHGSLLLIMGRKPGDGRIIRRPSELRITRQIVLPSGMCSAYRPVFHLMRDVPIPESDECLPCILSEATLKPVANSRCM